MGVAIFNEEYISPISPQRVFKASILDSHNLIPSLMPQAIKSIEFIQGTGEAGSIKQINFAQGNFKCLKYLIEKLDPITYTYHYSLIEGEALIDGLEKISYEVKFEARAEGGSISKVTSKYYTKGDLVLKEEEIKAGKERVLAMYKVVETYLINNPDAYV